MKDKSEIISATIEVRTFRREFCGDSCKFLYMNFDLVGKYGRCTLFHEANRSVELTLVPQAKSKYKDGFRRCKLCLDAPKETE